MKLTHVLGVCALVAAILALVYLNSWWQSANAQQQPKPPTAGTVEPSSSPSAVKPLEEVMNPTGVKPLEEHMNPAGVKDVEKAMDPSVVKTPDQLAKPTKSLDSVTKDASVDVDEVTLPPEN
jgi:hypothetical protein